MIFWEYWGRKGRQDFYWDTNSGGTQPCLWTRHTLHVSALAPGPRIRANHNLVSHFSTICFLFVSEGAVWNGRHRSAAEGGADGNFWSYSENFMSNEQLIKWILLHYNILCPLLITWDLGGPDGENQGLVEQLLCFARTSTPSVLAQLPWNLTELLGLCELEEELGTTEGMQLCGKLAWNWDVVWKKPDSSVAPYLTRFFKAPPTMTLWPRCGVLPTPKSLFSLKGQSWSPW